MPHVRLLGQLTHGHAADLYVALRTDPAAPPRLLAVKQLRQEMAEDPDFLAMFLEEARLGTRLQHPNIVQTLEVGVWDHRYFVAMEYLEGQPLSRVLDRMGVGDAATLPQHIRLLSDVLAGLHHAHTLRDELGTPLGVVHGDVTPRNVFVTYDGIVKLLDFGLANVAQTPLETRHDLLKGRLTYLSPERARGEATDCRADIFSVGVMLWQATTGRPL